MRTPALDKSSVLADGRRIVWHAFHEFVVRSAVVFDWNFITNKAIICITQLPTGESHEGVRDSFCDSLGSWFPVIGQFSLLDLRRAIGALDRHEAAGGTEVRPYKIRYDTVGGHSAEGTAGSENQPFHGEAVLITQCNFCVKARGSARQLLLAS